MRHESAQLYNTAPRHCSAHTRCCRGSHANAMPNHVNATQRIAGHIPAACAVCVRQSARRPTSHAACLHTQHHSTNFGNTSMPNQRLLLLHLVALNSSERQYATPRCPTEQSLSHGPVTSDTLLRIKDLRAHLNIVALKICSSRVSCCKSEALSSNTLSCPSADYTLRGVGHALHRFTL